MKRLLFLLLLTACASPATPPAPTADIAFPHGLAVDSPLQVTRLVNSSTLHPQAVPPSRAYQNDVNDIESVLSGASPALLFSNEAFFTRPSRANCFGPALLYQNHPDGGSGELPTGDLGLWLENEYKLVGTVFSPTNEACAAAQLNTRLVGLSQQAKAAMVFAAAALAQASPLPNPGSSLDETPNLNAWALGTVRFNSALVSQSPGGLWNYALKLELLQAGSWRAAQISLQHQPSSSGYSGLLSYQVNSVATGGNCGVGSNITLVGSTKYNKASSNLRVQSRSAVLCGWNQNSFDSNGQVDPSKAWADDFQGFTADFDPDSYAGSYAYVWQAGNADPNSRVLNLKLNNPASGETISSEGEAYYGYGEPVQSKPSLVMDIAGFYCNWAGPKPTGGSSGFFEYAQRQLVGYDSSKGVFVSPTAGSNIRYAPTQSCLNVSADFKYDRNLNRLFDESPEQLTVTPYGSGASTDLGLLQPSDTNGDGNKTIEESIAAQGYVAPRIP